MKRETKSAKIQVEREAAQSSALARIEPGAVEALTPDEARARTMEANLTALTLDVITSRHSKRAYARALENFWAWYRAQGRPVLRKATVQRFAAHLRTEGASAAVVNQTLCAVRRMLREAAANRLIDPLDAESAAAAEGISQPGSSVGNWLTREQAQMFLGAIERKGLRGLRDFALISLFLASGLRRSEMASLTVHHFQQREGRWLIVDLIGKRNKKRSIPIHAGAKAAVDSWLSAAGVEEGLVFRAINKSDVMTTETITDEGIRFIIENRIKQANQKLAVRATSLPNVRAHDLRRTFAMLARQGGSELEQIMLSLGHESLETTQRYLGTKQNLKEAPSDSIGLEFV